jgi:putative phosphonate catabolism associated alcohol dehydrogenase
MTTQPPTAAVWSGVEHGFTVTGQPVPELRDGEVLVAVELATVCGSDLHTITGRRPTPLPTVLGHEAVGRVVATRGPVPAADGRVLAPGDRVTWTIGTACGTCRRCRRGIPQKCLDLRKYGHEAMDGHWRLNGGLASHCHLLAGTGIVPVPEDLPAEVAAPANCATATVTGAARRIGLDPTDHVVVIGCGMLGLTAVAYARHLGAEQVLACDPNPDRLELAEHFGATATCAPDRLPVAAREHGADAILEISGSTSAVQAALDIVDTGGRVALVGSVFPAPPVPFEPNTYVRNLTTVVGCHNYRLDDLVEAVRFLHRTPDRQRFADLVPATYPLAEIDRAIVAARNDRAPRIAVRPT